MAQRGRKFLATLALAAAGFTGTGLAHASAIAEAPAGSLSGAFLAARVAETDNDLSAAIAYYTQALAFDPSNQALQQSLMLALVSAGDFDKALPYAQKLKSVAEVERFSRLALAVDAFRAKDYRAAENWLKLALETDLDRLITGLMSGWAKLGEGDAGAAIDHIARLGGPDWFEFFVSYHRALIADVAHRRAEAERAYEAVLQNVSAGGAAPDTYLRAAEAYAGLLARNGEKDKALAVLDKADAFVAGRLPIAALRRKIEAGETVAPFLAGPGEGAAEVLIDLGTALNRGGGEDFVRLYLQYALVLVPESDAALLQLGILSEEQRKPEDAIGYYGRIPESSPMKQVAELQAGLNLADVGRHDEAVQHLKSVLASDPDNMRAYLALGGVYSSKEDYRSAADLYDQAVARLAKPSPSDWNVFYQRGIAYERLKQWPKAEPNFRKALELSPDQPQVLNYLGYSWVDLNVNLQEALDMIRKAVSLRPGDGYIVDSLGWAYYRLGRFDEAVVELERAISLKPEDPVLNDHLGDAYWRVGRKLQARFQWSHARDLKPDADVLASVQKKLAEGLPDEPTRIASVAAAGNGKVANDAVTGAAAPPAPAGETRAPKKEEAPEQVAKDASPPPQQPAPEISYTVGRGQSLWTIARDRLGAGERYRDILELNPGIGRNPNLIYPGQTLRLPSAN